MESLEERMLKIEIDKTVSSNMEKNCNLASKVIPAKCLLPQIPWLADENAGMTDFSSSMMAKVLNRQDAAKDKQQLLEALSKLIPSYLPAR